ncbi:hypothetical protein B0H34DRAFT_159626 [Crassisporium funariophilum]|nr:hypothetical protein B0H34DRAFT_159626 [Crassisporium funariophilum]
MASLPKLNLDNTLGAAFLGNILAAVLYGITCLQTFVYYKKSQNDHLSFRLVIYFLWIIDTLHLALVTHGLYFYLVKSYANPSALASPTWSLLSQIVVTCVSDLIVRGIYGRRVWKISGRSIIIASLITFTSIVTFGAGIAFTSRAFIERTFANFSHISYLLYLALGSAVAADILIAVCLCVSLSRSRTGFKKTDSIVTVLMLYAINSSVLTTLCSMACFITYAIWPMEFTFIGIYVCLSKLFLNSLLAMLNGRSGLQARAHGFSDAPAAFSQGSSRPTDFVTSFASKDVYEFENMPRPLVISVNRSIVETRENV